MKKLFTLLFVLTFALSNALMAQTVTIASGVVDDSPVDVPVSVELGAFEAGSFTFDIIIDPPDANFVGINSVNPSFASDPVPTTTLPGIARVSWTDFGSPITGSLVLFNLRFTAPIGTYSLTFNNFGAGGTELTDTSGTATDTTWGDGNFESLSNIPFKNWAVYLGFGLIFAFVIVRFRRLF